MNQRYRIKNWLGHTDKITDNDLQLQTITLDNASNNTTSCEMIEQQHQHHDLQWNSKENQLP